MRRRLWLGLVLAGAGCSAPCELEAGTYDVGFVRTSGDCGEQPNGTIVLGAGQIPGPFGPSCFGSLDVSDDGCMANFDQTCGSGADAVTISGFTTVIDPDIAVSSFQLRAPAVPCSGTYDAQFTRRR
ncbi:MAG: hypothetical protein KC619_06110 [Myxococcales bacterium]|nr:hypothetical protein [Myxococcales bacterium]